MDVHRRRPLFPTHHFFSFFILAFTNRKMPMIYTLSGFILSFPKLYSRSYPLTISTGYSFTLWLHHLEEEKASWHYFSLSLRVTELFCCDQDLVALLSTRPLDVLLLVLLCDPCRRLWQEPFFALSNLSEDLPTPTYSTRK